MRLKEIEISSKSSRSHLSKSKTDNTKSRRVSITVKTNNDVESVLESQMVFKVPKKMRDLSNWYVSLAETFSFVLPDNFRIKDCDFHIDVAENPLIEGDDNKVFIINLNYNDTLSNTTIH